jgi:hypothetical protein
MYRNPRPNLFSRLKMLRCIVFGMFVVLMNTATCDVSCAQEWARKMFEVSEHDFGTVARDSDIEYRFKFKNLYKEDVHIASISSSCSCTTATVTEDTLHTYETSEIVAKFNTSAFYGQKKATITVRIDRPYYAEVQLQVEGVIRTDVSFSPGKVDLGSIGQGKSTTKAVTVSQRGKNNWKIADVKSNLEYVDVSLKETHRAFGSANYEIAVTLKENAPIGFVHGAVTIETNERNGEVIPIPFSGKVVPPLEVSPATLSLGPVSPGESVSNKILVRAKQPFKIVDVSCVDTRFEVKADGESKPIHFLNVTYNPGEDLKERYECELEIKTDLQPDGIVKVPVIITRKTK